MNQSKKPTPKKTTLKKSPIDSLLTQVGKNVERATRQTLDPLHGKRHMPIVRNPKKTIENKIANEAAKGVRGVINGIFK